MKFSRGNLIKCLLCVCIVLAFVIKPSFAVGDYGVDFSSDAYQSTINPFYNYRGNSTDGTGGECTWYVWGRVYEKLGIALPNFHNAKEWTANAESCGYETGSEARADSIMVEDDGSQYGHVFFVEKVENGYAYVTEGNWLGRYHQDVIDLSNNTRSYSAQLGQIRYIYLHTHEWEYVSTKVQIVRSKSINGYERVREYTYYCSECGKYKTEREILESLAEVSFATGDNVSGDVYPIMVTVGTGVTIPDASSRREGYYLCGWSETYISAEVQYVSGDVITLYENKVLYPVFRSVPTIQSQPNDARISVGKDIAFSAIVPPKGEYTYQWQIKEKLSITWENVGASGPDASSYSFTAQQEQDGRVVRCIVSDEYENVLYTNEIVVRVFPAIINQVFPDNAFSQYISENYDVDKDGILSQEEIQNITHIEVGLYQDSSYWNGDRGKIYSLEGIEYLPNLKYLDCRYQYISKLDVSKNTELEYLDCGHPYYRLTSLNVSNNTKLKYLDCNYNSLDTLDVSNNELLEYLYCNSDRLSGLNVSHNTSLRVLDCSNNEFSSLDVSGNGNLERLICNYNKITDVRFPANGKLKYIDCSHNTLASLDFRGNTAIEELDCSWNKLTKLNIGDYTQLKKLVCEYNYLEDLIVSNNTELVYLDCDRNLLSQLIVNNNKKLTHLSCSGFAKGPTGTIFWDGEEGYDGNYLSSLDVSDNKLLEELFCGYNQLTALDISENTALKFFSCYGNHLNELNVSSNLLLRELSCGYNSLSLLNVTMLPQLEYLNCGWNQLTELDVSHNLQLKYLYCEENELTELCVSNNTLVEVLHCTCNDLAELLLDNNPGLRELDCQGMEKLEELDLSNNLLIETLYCGGTGLISLDVRKCSLLQELDVMCTPLTYVDISAMKNIGYVGLVGISNIFVFTAKGKSTYFYTGYGSNSGVCKIEEETQQKAVGYYLNGGNLDGESYQVAIKGSTIVLPTPRRSGKKFLGWTSNPRAATYSSDAISSTVEIEFYGGSTFVLNENTVLYALWEDTAIVTQPVDASASVGDIAHFTVEVTNGLSCSFQWQYRKNASTAWNNSGQTGNKTATLSVATTIGLHGYQFRCVVSNNGKLDISDVVTLTVKPKITMQPVNKSLLVGSTAKFTVAATGKGTLKYQWQYRKDETNAWASSGQQGAKTDTLLVSTTAALHGYQFRCVVTDGNNQVSYSDTVTLKLKPRITTQPVDKSLLVNSTAKFTVAATGKATLTYQWQYRKNASSAWANSGQQGAKTDTLMVSTTAALHGYQFRCVVTDGNGQKSYSNAATLTLKPRITTQPVDKDLLVGSTAKFTVEATGKATLKYQWQYRKNESAEWANSGQQGAKTDTLLVSTTAALHGYQFRCIVTDGNGQVTYSKTVTLRLKPRITTQPTDTSATAGTKAQFTVAAIGKSTLTYQWQYRKNASSEWANSGQSGNKTATLSVATTKSLNGYQFRCIVTDGNNRKTYSSVVTLTVK